MGKETLVDSAARLIHALEAAGTVVKGAMWVTLPETGGWRLWIITPKNADKKDFYRQVAEALPGIEESHPEFSISDVEMKHDEDPVIKALGFLFKVPGIADITTSRTMVNGVYTPEGILLRMDL